MLSWNGVFSKLLIAKATATSKCKASGPKKCKDVQQWQNNGNISSSPDAFIPCEWYKDNNINS